MSLNAFFGYRVNLEGALSLHVNLGVVQCAKFEKSSGNFSYQKFYMKTIQNFKLH